jgi:hypothetical protein
VFSGKLNKLRTIAMLILIFGFIIMYLGLWAKSSPILMTILLILGLIIVLASSSSYFWIGMLSTRAVQVECPSCGKVTKMLGKYDECMFCKQKITLDPAMDPSRKEKIKQN